MDTGPDESQVCAAMGDILNRIGDKWSVMVVGRLEGGTMRFSQLLREIDGVSQRMLTLTLRNLEREGFVIRHYFPEVPPRVEYELTEIGHGALRALEGFNFWVHDNLNAIKAHRRAYDQTES
jgi:DNA-binding HxlR family transcriptional regulator